MHTTPRTEIGHRYLKLSREKECPTQSAQPSTPTIHINEHANAMSFSWDVRSSSEVTDSEPSKEETGAITDDCSHGSVGDSFNGK